MDGAVSAYFDDDDAVELVGDDGFAPNGKQRLRFAGRWFKDSQSSERFRVTHAMTVYFNFTQSSKNWEIINNECEDIFVGFWFLSIQ